MVAAGAGEHYFGKKPLGVGIIGCGAIFDTHAEAVAASESARLVSVADINNGRVKRAADTYKCAYFNDYRKMLDDDKVDVIHLCTPHYLHVPMAIEILDSDKHVIIEKPVGISCAQVKELEKAAGKSKCLASVIFQNRYNESSIKAKELVENNTLGRLKGIKGIVTWHRSSDYYVKSGWRGRFDTEGGGVSINQAIHTLDLMQWFGGSIKSIMGHAGTYLLDEVIEVEDTANALIRFDNGAIGIFFATNCYTSNSPVEIELDFEKGKLMLYNNKLILDNGQGREILVDNTAENVKYKDYWGCSHKRQIEEFYCTVLNGGRGNYISVGEGKISLKMVEAIIKAK